MLAIRIKYLAVSAIITGCAFQMSWARDIRVTLPRHSELTPVQRLNREGVRAVQKHDYEKAEAFFYKAYLYDAADPFTLNNLGYISELEGKLDRAEQFYALAGKQDSDARIDMSNAKQLEGKPMTDALTGLKDLPMRVNRMNVDAIGLLSQSRNVEADHLLQQALKLDPKNPFTLNNLGVADEATGNLENALKFYDAAADSHSKEPVVVTLKRAWRGKPLSEMAADSAWQLRKRMRNANPEDTRATMLTWRGVSAINQNDWSAAKQDFLEAYALNPNSAFSMNNLGYVAEKNGDMESAQFYYSKARKANGAQVRIGLATEPSVEGRPLATVADESGRTVGDEIDRYRQAARRQTGPIELIRRNNTPANPSATPNQPAPPVSPNSGPQTPK